MEIRFLGQGFEETSMNAVGNYLINYLNQNSFHSFTAFSAFASESGIFGLSEHIQNAKRNFQAPNKVRIIVGVDQKGTSKEALEELNSLNVESYIFYQSEYPIFHPKIYLFEGNNQTKIILGSSNLTRTGLFINVESSILVEFDNNDPEGNTFLSSLKAYYQTLFDLTDPNLIEISDLTITSLFDKGIIPDEVNRKRIFNSKTRTSNHSSTEESVNYINTPRRGVASVPSTFPRKTSTRSYAIPNTNYPNNNHVNQQPTTLNISNNRIVVWKKNKLSQSDAQMVPTGTAITGNLKLSQAKFKINNDLIDQTTYFRNNVFRHLTWIKTKPNNDTYEEAICNFRIIINSIIIGTYPLKLSHDPIRIAGQGNTPTWLHWGNSLIQILQQHNVASKSLILYALDNNFILEIE